jgi:hypothetical protein
MQKKQTEMGTKAGRRVIFFGIGAVALGPLAV